MSDTITSFFAAWGEPDMPKRAAMTAGAISDNFYYADPNAPDVITSLVGFVAYLGMFSKAMPGASAEVVSVSEHNGHARATVDFKSNGQTMMRGQYFADLDDEGRITRMVGFTGTGEG